LGLYARFYVSSALGIGRRRQMVVLAVPHPGRGKNGRRNLTRLPPARRKWRRFALLIRRGAGLFACRPTERKFRRSGFEKVTAATPVVRTFPLSAVAHRPGRFRQVLLRPARDFIGCRQECRNFGAFPRTPSK